MAAYIDSDYIDAFIGSDEREGLFTDNGTYTASYETQVITSASERVLAAANAAGYSLGSTTTNELVKQATFGQFIVLAYGRKGLTPPERYTTEILMADNIRLGRIIITSSSPDNLQAVGAADFTSSDPDDTTGVAEGDVKPQIFKTLRSVW